MRSTARRAPKVRLPSTLCIHSGQPADTRTRIRQRCEGATVTGMDPAPADARRLVAGSAVIAFAVSLVAVASAGFGLIAAVPAVAGMALSLRARVQLQDSPYRGYGISLVAFLLAVGVLAWALVPAVMQLLMVVAFILPD